MRSFDNFIIVFIRIICSNNMSIGHVVEKLLESPQLYETTSLQHEWKSIFVLSSTKEGSKSLSLPIKNQISSELERLHLCMSFAGANKVILRRGKTYATH